jgi:PAS domain S-box-containing protein
MLASASVSSLADYWWLGASLLVCGICVLLALAVRRKRREQAREAEEHRRNAAIVEASGEGVLELDPKGLVRFANPAAARLLERDTKEMVGVDYREFIAATVEESNSEPHPVTRALYTTDMQIGVGALLRCKNGRHRPIEYKIVPVAAEGRTVGTVLSFRDVSERVRLDTMLNDMQLTAKVGAWEAEVKGDRISITPGMSRHLGLGAGRSVARSRAWSLVHPEDTKRLRVASAAALVKGNAFDCEFRLAARDAENELWVRCIGKAERFQGRTIKLYGTLQDITQNKLAERKLREMRDFYELTLNAMPTWVLHLDTQEVVTYCNDAVERGVTLPKASIVGKKFAAVMALPDFYVEAQPAIAAALQGQGATLAQHFPESNGIREVQVHYLPDIGENGRVSGCFLIAYDISELKRLEARLVQAEKLQAIGQLTGGIAHDFNNLLGVVLGNLQLIERDLGGDPALSRKLSIAIRAALRGADLTRRLLAFARRQILDPVVVDLNRQISALGELLRRTLGESIETQLRLRADLWHTRVDPGQLENAILNLAINARDAMPNGGRLSVDTSNELIDAAFCENHADLEPGEYVTVRVTDTGCGMTPDVLARVFEPFFTTKESGKGSGLGLAMVHGFSKQSGGSATITSAVDRGTTVCLYLPRSMEKQTRFEDTIVHKIVPGGTETILVVEDDSDLRETAVASLGRLGYRMLSAHNAEAALRILSGNERVDLLFTDVMMPGGMLGPMLAKQAYELRPGIEVLFTTGYADTSLLPASVLGKHSELISKPYRNEELALKIRGLLDKEVRVA